MPTLLCSNRGRRGKRLTVREHECAPWSRRGASEMIGLYPEQDHLHSTNFPFPQLKRDQSATVPNIDCAR